MHIFIAETSESYAQQALLGCREHREAVILKVLRKQGSWGVPLWTGPEISIIIKGGMGFKHTVGRV